MVALPASEWRQRPGLDQLIEALGAADGMARFVGGAVRDTLIGLPVADLDIATRHAPEDVVALLRRAGIKVVPTGLVHGTVTAVVEGWPVEVTTLRRDVATDGRHATVAFTDDWRDDAARRDFTINALYADPLTGEVFDYFDGLVDLDARRVRFIGDPLQRIAEDHLRILRYFRFLARFGDSSDAESLAACASRANDLMALSRERIRDEFLKLLVAKDAVHVLRLMLERGILKPVLPEITDATGLERLATREAEAGIVADPIRRLAALLPPKDVEAVGARLKLSNDQRRRVESAALSASNGDAMELGYRLGIDRAIDRLLLADRPVAQAVVLANWSRPALPITGGALVARGLRKGPLVAATLRRIEDRWIAEAFPDAARVERIADEEVVQALQSDSNA